MKRQTNTELRQELEKTNKLLMEERHAATQLAGRLDALEERVQEVNSKIEQLSKPIPMLLWCPMCHARHIDEGEFATKPHHTHACQNCGLTWRPAVVATVGVQFLPGFKNEQAPSADPDFPLCAGSACWVRVEKPGEYCPWCIEKMPRGANNG